MLSVGAVDPFQIDDETALKRACGVVVSHLLCMQKASGSNPDKSKAPFSSMLLAFWAALAHAVVVVLWCNG